MIPTPYPQLQATASNLLAQSFPLFTLFVLLQQQTPQFLLPWLPAPVPLGELLSMPLFGQGCAASTVYTTTPCTQPLPPGTLVILRVKPPQPEFPCLTCRLWDTHPSIMDSRTLAAIHERDTTLTRVKLYWPALP